MTRQEVSSRPELRAADDAVIEDAIAHADPMVLRGLVYQLTGDPEVAATGVKTVLAGYFDVASPATEADVALLRRKGAEFLKAYATAARALSPSARANGLRSAWV